MSDDSESGRLRRRTYEVLELSKRGDAMARFVSIGIGTLVLGNVVAVVLESVEALELAYGDLFEAFERVSVAAFTAELLLRVWVAAEEAPRAGTEWRARLRYLSSPMALIDLIAIAPFYLSGLYSVDLRFMRVMRLLRLLKLTRYSESLSRIAQVLRLQKGALAASVLLMVMTMVVAASGLYVLEHDAQPEAFGSIPAAMWWAVCTLTTVGYGDVTPVTPLGKAVASLIAIVGIGMVALPTSLLATGFVEVIGRNRRSLEAQARKAMEDGVIDDEERRAYDLLAEQLGVEPEIAHEIIAFARDAETLPAPSDCPHCGKSLAV